MKRKGNSHSEKPLKKQRNASQSAAHVRFLDTNNLKNNNNIKSATDETVDELEDKVAKVRNVRNYQKVLQNSKESEQENASIQKFNEEKEEDAIFGDINIDNSSGTINKVSGEEMFQNTDSKKWNPEVDEERYKQGSRIYDEGVMYEPFNLTSEREEGAFKEDGTYVSEKSKTRQAVEMELYKKKKQEFIQQLSGEGKIAREKRRKYDQNQESDDDDDEADKLERDSFVDQLEDTEYVNMMSNKFQKSKPIRPTPTSSSTPSLTTSQCKQILIDSMETEEETVLEALQRVKNDKYSKSLFEQMTNAIVQLSTQSEDSIYSKTKKEISSELDNTKQTVQWMYKWSKEDSEEYGPYDTYTIRYWQQTGHFQGYSVVVKKVKESNDEEDMFEAQDNKADKEQTDYVPLESIDFSLYK